MEYMIIAWIGIVLTFVFVGGILRLISSAAFKPLPGELTYIIQAYHPIPFISFIAISDVLASFYSSLLHISKHTVISMNIICIAVSLILLLQHSFIIYQNTSCSYANKLAIAA